MLISAIRRQKGTLFAIYSEGEQMAVLDIQVLESADDLAVGLDVSEERLSELQDQSDLRRARNKALSMVARRELCRKGLIRKLCDNGFDSDIAECTADEMERLDFVNDRRYAEMTADEMYRIQKYARRRVSYELSQKGIDRELASEIAAELEPDAAEVLDELLGGRLARDTDSEAGIRRCMNTLMRYGYETHDIYSALKRLADSIPDQPDD